MNYAFKMMAVMLALGVLGGGVVNADSKLLNSSFDLDEDLVKFSTSNIDVLVDVKNRTFFYGNTTSKSFKKIYKKIYNRHKSDYNKYGQFYFNLDKLKNAQTWTKAKK